MPLDCILNAKGAGDAGPLWRGGRVVDAFIAMENYDVSLVVCSVSISILFVEKN